MCWIHRWIAFTYFKMNYYCYLMDLLYFFSYLFQLTDQTIDMIINQENCNGLKHSNGN